VRLQFLRLFPTFCDWLFETAALGYACFHMNAISFLRYLIGFLLNMLASVLQRSQDV
jgi:hypothetical protein